jgi:hypothetical protein
MAKYLDHTAVMDVGLTAIKNGAISMVFCSAAPANFAGVAAVTLITQVISSSDLTLANDTSGRKLTVGAKTGMTPSSNGTVIYVVLTDNSAIMYAGTTVTSQAVTTSQTWNSPAFKIAAIADPT